MTESLLAYSTEIEPSPQDDGITAAERAELFALLVGDILSESELWDLRGACKDKEDLFFPPAGKEKVNDREMREAAAIAICALCPVREECLEYAKNNDERYGIWGGLKEEERKTFQPKVHQPKAA